MDGGTIYLLDLEPLLSAAQVSTADARKNGSPRCLSDRGSQERMGNTGKNMEFLQLRHNFVSSEEPVLLQRRT